MQLQREAAELAKERQQNGAAHSDSGSDDDSGDDSGSEGEGRGQQHGQHPRAAEQQAGALGQLAIPKGVFSGLAGCHVAQDPVMWHRPFLPGTQNSAAAHSA